MFVLKALRALVFGGGLASAAGWLLFLAVLANFARHHGSRWEFGRWGMPRSLVSAADPYRYADGAPIDPATLALSRAGMEEPFFAAAGVFCAGGLLVAGVKLRRIHRLRVRMHRRLLEAERQRAAGPPLCARHRRQHP